MFNDPEKGRQFNSSFKCLQAEDIARSVLHIISAPSHVEAAFEILKLFPNSGANIQAFGLPLATGLCPPEEIRKR
ncbi:hypothetical protein Avbf_14046 [Armadillidium vulgare]|nr:hypothetical protein Avbf_14046 [Armadillidium vulgare]